MRRRLLALMAIFFMLPIGLAVGPAGCGKAPAATRGGLGPAPDFDLPDLQGGRLTKGDLKGKVAILDFWATWCGPCIEEIPRYREFARKNEPNGVEVVGVVFDSGEPAEIAEFVRTHQISYRQLLGTDATLDGFGAGLGFPTTFVLDGEGRIVAKVLGSPPGKFDALQRAVDEALAKPPA